eukprot:COSAG04_NODE_68_length_29323_cov_9.683514_11_plen_1093_part_00
MPASADASLVPAKDAERDSDGDDADEDTPLLQELAQKVARLDKSNKRLEGEAAEMRLRAELLDQAVGVPKPGSSLAVRARLFLMGQVNSKLARFGTTRGAIIASLVLLCNAAFIWLFVTTTVSDCEQRSAIMNPKPMINGSYTEMFIGSNTHMCASSVEASHVYTPGDTCTTFTGEWLGKNRVCDVNACAPGTDCTDCPTDPACDGATMSCAEETLKAGSQNAPSGCPDSCACEHDSFCCTEWDVTCSLCELGLNMEDAARVRPHYLCLQAAAEDPPRVSSRCGEDDQESYLVRGLRSGELEDLLENHLSQVLMELGGDAREQTFLSKLRTGTCAANACGAELGLRADDKFPGMETSLEARGELMQAEKEARRTVYEKIVGSNQFYTPQVNDAVLNVWEYPTDQECLETTSCPLDSSPLCTPCHYSYRTDDHPEVRRNWCRLQARFGGPSSNGQCDVPGLLFHDGDFDPSANRWGTGCPGPEACDPLFVDPTGCSVCQTNATGACEPGTDCTDCPWDPACPETFEADHWNSAEGNRVDGSEEPHDGTDGVCEVELREPWCARTEQLRDWCTGGRRMLQDVAASTPPQGLPAPITAGNSVMMIEFHPDKFAREAFVDPAIRSGHCCSDVYNYTTGQYGPSDQCSDNCESARITTGSFEATVTCERRQASTGPGTRPHAAKEYSEHPCDGHGVLHTLGPGDTVTLDSEQLPKSADSAANLSPASAISFRLPDPADARCSWTISCADASMSPQLTFAALDLVSTDRREHRNGYGIYGTSTHECSALSIFDNSESSDCETNNCADADNGVCDVQFATSGVFSNAEWDVVTESYSERELVERDYSAGSCERGSDCNDCSPVKGWTGDDYSCNTYPADHGKLTDYLGVPGTDCNDCPTDPACADYHQLRHDSCASEDDDIHWVRDGICQVDTGECHPGTDCSDCPLDVACPGVNEERWTPCHLQGVPCDEYVGADSALTDECGVPDSLVACADADCATVSAKSTVASVLYVTCPKMSTQLGVGMGYVFVVEMLAITVTVTGAVLLSGGSFGSAWDQTRSILRGEMATEAAEAATLLEEEKRLGSPKEAGAAQDAAARP